MGHQGALDALVVHALLDGDGDLAAQLHVLALAGAVHGAVADGQGVHPGLLEELNGGEGVGVGGVGGKDVVLHAGQHAQLALHGHAAGVGVLDHLAGELHILLKGEGGAVDHHGGVPPLDGGHAGVEVLAVIQVEHHGDGAVLGELLHRLGDVAGPLLLVLQGAVCKVHPAAHEGVGQVGPLQNGRGAEHLVYGDDRLGLGHGVDVEGPLGIAIFHGGVQNRTQRYQRHSNSPFGYSLILYRRCARPPRCGPPGNRRPAGPDRRPFPRPAPPCRPSP